MVDPENPQCQSISYKGETQSIDRQAARANDEERKTTSREIQYKATIVETYNEKVLKAKEV